MTAKNTPASGATEPVRASRATNGWLVMGRVSTSKSQHQRDI